MGTKPADYDATLFNQPTEKGTTNFDIDVDVLRKSKSGNSYDLMDLRTYLGSMNVQIQNSKNKLSIDKQRLVINNILSSAKRASDIKGNKSYNDSYLGWIATKTNPANISSQFKEVSLFESYSFFYITQFLYIIKKNGWVDESPSNKKWWLQTLSFVEKNEWNKWYQRSYIATGKHYLIFLRGRTHMGSHWAGVAMYLSKMTQDAAIKKQCEKMQHDYDLLIKRNLKPDPNNREAYIWNSTYDNVTGTDAIATKPSIIQDVSHGNHVISYIVAAYELGDSSWTLTDLRKFSITFNQIIYNKSKNNFSDNVNGSGDKDLPGRGNYISDGWLKLGKYDKQVSRTIRKAISNKEVIKYNRSIKQQHNSIGN